MAEPHTPSTPFYRHYSTKFREVLAAGPESINMREKSPFFYEVRRPLAELSARDRRRDLSRALESPGG
jgi:hypothetical protein